MKLEHEAPQVEAPVYGFTLYKLYNKQKEISSQTY